MCKRHFIRRKTPFILIGAVGLSFFLSFTAVAQSQPDTTTAVLKIRKKYTEGDYFPRIHDKVTGAIKRSELMDPRGIYTVAPLHITAFELHSFQKEKEIILKSNSCFLTPVMKAHIKKLHSGAIIYFRNIVAYDEKDKKYLLNGMRYVIDSE